MSNAKTLPAGWAWAEFGQLLREPLRNGHSAKASGNQTGVPTFTLTAVTTGDFSSDNIKHTVADPEKVADLWVEPGDILIERSNTPELVGTTRLYRGPRRQAIFPDLIIRARLLEHVDKRYVEAYLHSQTARRYFQSRAQGIAGSMPKIDQPTVERLPIPIAPHDEQARIVDEIEKQLTRIDAGVAALKRVQVNLKRQRAAILKAACEGRLVPTEAELARAEGRSYEPAEKLLERILEERRARWEAEQLARMKAKGQAPKDETWKSKYREPRQADHNPVSVSPPGWAWASLEQIAHRITDGTHQPPQFTADGVPFVFVKHIVGGAISFDDTKFISHETYRQLNERCPVESGDMLYSAVGSYGVAVPVLTDVPFSFQRHIAHIKPTGLVDLHYLVYCMNSHVCLQQAHAFARGVAQKTVALGDLARYRIPLPPLAEQHRITAEIQRRTSVLDNIAAAVEANLARAEHLRQSVLQRAFEGKLVPHDPSDEPASALLDRLRTERTHDEPNEPKRRSPRRRPAPADQSDPA